MVEEVLEKGIREVGVHCIAFVCVFVAASE